MSPDNPDFSIWVAWLVVVIVGSVALGMGIRLVLGWGV